MSTDEDRGHAARRGVLACALCLAAILVLANLVYVAYPRLPYDHDSISDLASRTIKELDLGRERNLATWLTSALLLTGALWAYQLRHSVAPSRNRTRSAWLLIAVGLCLLSADDIAGIHERVESTARDFAETYDIEIERSVVGASFGALLAVGLVIVSRFGLWQPADRRERRRLVGVVLCIAVVVAAELVEAALGCRSGTRCSRVEVLLEEGGELFAILLFLRFQLDWLRYSDARESESCCE